MPGKRESSEPEKGSRSKAKAWESVRSGTAAKGLRRVLSDNRRSSPRSSGLHRARKAHSARYRILSDRVHSVPRKARSVLHRILSARADSDRNRLRSDKTDRSQIRSARASGPSRQRSVRHKAARAHSGLLPVRPGRVPAQDSGAAARPPWEAAEEN